MFSITFQLVTKTLCFFRYVIKLPTDLVDFLGVSASQNEFSDVSLAIKVCSRRLGGLGPRDDGSREGLRGRKILFFSFFGVFRSVCGGFCLEKCFYTI